MSAEAGSTTLQTLLGFDYGKLRIGIAVGQGITGTASTLCTLNCPDGRPNWDKISDLIAEWSPGSLVVGLPLHADGSDSAVTRAARSFARELEARYQLPVYTMDERLSSHAAKEVQREIPGKHKGGIDAIAARIILQNWLDTTRHV
jgi:putative Holliday junction resolvase